LEANLRRLLLRHGRVVRRVRGGEGGQQQNTAEEEEAKSSERPEREEEQAVAAAALGQAEPELAMGGGGKLERAERAYNHDQNSEFIYIAILSSVLKVPSPQLRK
jgi:hypothetical protein